MSRKCMFGRVLVTATVLLATGCAGPPATAPSPPVPAPVVPSLPADLPADADRSDVARQLALLGRGLYLTTAGEVRALPARYAKASWSAGAKAPVPEKANPQSEERIHILLEEREVE